MSYDVLIIGGGIVGFSTALQLLQKDNSLNVAVLEKEPHPAVHQTGHNSGVIHAGVYYQPGSLKAKFCVEGCAATKEFCQTHNIPFKVPGKLIVAVKESELERLQALSERCQKNGLTVEGLSPEALKKSDLDSRQLALMQYWHWRVKAIVGVILMLKNVFKLCHIFHCGSLFLNI